MIRLGNGHPIFADPENHGCPHVLRLVHAEEEEIERCIAEALGGWVVGFSSGSADELIV